MVAGDTDFRMLASKLEGCVIRSSDANYEAIRRVWNGMIDRRPLAIARCASEADVAVAIRFAAQRELPVSVWKANFLDELSDALIDTVVEAFARVPSRYSGIAFEPMGGAVARIGETDTAFCHRKSAFSLLLLGGWDEPPASDTNVAWVRELWERTQPLSSAGVYVNYLGAEGAERIRDAYGVNYDRLVAVKRKYDPHNFFRYNQNVPPGANSAC